MAAETARSLMMECYSHVGSISKQKMQSPQLIFYLLVGTHHRVVTTLLGMCLPCMVCLCITAVCNTVVQNLMHPDVYKGICMAYEMLIPIQPLSEPSIFVIVRWKWAVKKNLPYFLLEGHVKPHHADKMPPEHNRTTFFPVTHHPLLTNSILSTNLSDFLI